MKARVVVFLIWIVFFILIGLASSARALSFAPAVNYWAGVLPKSEAVGDFNGDGKLDLAVANSGVNYVSILLGNGDGTFQTAVNYTVVNDPRSVAVGDFNNDGKLDLAVSTYWSGISILLGNGDGTFATAVNYGAGGSPVSVAVGDFNGDGKLDLVAANYGSDNVSILLGNGNGTFQAAVNYGVGSGPESVVVGDFNRDGKLDLAATNLGNTVSILLGNGDGTFATAVNYGAGSGPLSVAVGDFNRDGKLDLAVANYYSYGTVSILLGNGNGTFQASTIYGAASGFKSVAVGDFNRDGKLDLAVANKDQYYVSLLLGNGNGTFQAAVNYGVGSGPEYVAVGDFNRDGKLDLAVANTGGATVSILLNTNYYIITADAGAGGAITPPGVTKVIPNGSQSYTITANTGYHVSEVWVDGISVGAVTSYNFTNVQDDHDIVASFAPNTYTITASAGTNGSINPSGAVTVEYGKNLVLAITPNTGYNVADVLVDGGSVGAVTSYQFISVAANHTIAASFALTETVSTPTIPSGPAIIVDGVSYNYSSGGSTSNYSHTVQYRFDWGDGTISSWGAVTQSHWWEPGGPYTVKAQARCVSDTAVESLWSGGLTVTVYSTSVILLMPLGGEVIPSGSNYLIQWSAPSPATKFNLWYSYDNGTTWKAIATGVPGYSYNWTVPAPWNNRRQCRVRVVGFSSSNVKIGADASQNFTVEVVRLTAPNGGETWYSGTPYNITWSTNVTRKSVAKVILSYTKDGGLTWYRIGTLTSNDVTYPWTPAVAATRSNCKVKVVLKDSAGNVVGSDVSNAKFTLMP